MVHHGDSEISVTAPARRVRSPEATGWDMTAAAVPAAPFTPQWTMLTFPFAREICVGRMKLNSLFALARSRGLTGLDMFAVEIWLYGAKRVKHGLDQNELTLSSLIVGVGFLADSAKMSRKIEKAVRTAKRFGCRRIMLAPMDALTSGKGWAQVSERDKLEHYVRGFGLAVDIASRSGIEILVEDTPTIGSALSSAADCRALLDRVPGLGLVYDTGNMIPSGDDPIEFFHATKDRIRYVHLKDVEVADKGTGDRTVDGRHVELRAFGDGIVPLTEIVQLIAADGYRGPMAIEYMRPPSGASLSAHSAQLDRFVGAARALVEPLSPEPVLTPVPPFRWAYIGSGAIAKSTSRQILRTTRHEIATVFSRNAEKRAAFASKVGARPAPTLEAAINDPAVDGVYIASPANSHAELTLRAIALGKPILLEKPFTVDHASAEQLFTLAKESDVYLAEAMWTWFSPVARQVRTWVNGGRIGDVKDVQVTIALGILPFVPRLKDASLVGGALLDLGIYGTSYAVNLFGVPDRIEATGEMKYGVDVDEEITFHYDSGPTVRIVISIVKSKGEMITINGTKGMIKVPGFHGGGKAMLIPGRGRRVVFHGNGGYDNEFDLVAREMRAGCTESAYVTPQMTLDNLKVLDECRRLLGIRYPFEAAVDT
jgi:predicted dehydrogenase/sugar phosphate isomerase/epimerase